MAWEKVKLGDIAICIQPGPFGSQLHNSDYSESGTPIIMPKDMIDGKISHSNLIFVGEEHTKRLCRHQVHAGNLMVARKGDVRKCVFITENEDGWMTGSDCLKVALKENYCYPRFIYYQLRSPFIGRWLEKISIGATMPSINTGLLSSIELVLPSLKEQKRIADILSAYDNLIENNQKQIKLLEEAAGRLYKQWFIDLRYPGHETTPIVDGLPKGWSITKIQDVCDNIGAGGTPSRSQKAFWQNGNIDWFKTQELCDCWLFEASEKISEEGLKRSAAKMFPANSILMAIYASPTLGRLGILTKEACSNQAALCLQTDESKVSNYWLYLKLFELRDRFNSIARGAGQQNISGIIVKETEITLPAYSVMENFTEMVKPFFEKQRTLQLQNISLTQTRDRLLPKLMNGEIQD